MEPKDIIGRAIWSDDEAIQRDARRILARLNAMPMSEILAKVPGETVVAKCALLGVTRVTWFYWMSGRNRPRNKAARKLAKITGLSVAEIRGLDVTA